MWIFSGPLTRQITNRVFLYKRTQLFKQLFCTAPSNPIIPDDVKYPIANKKLKDYLDNLIATQANLKHKNGPLLNRLLQRYEYRLSIVDQYNELAREMVNESNKEIVAMATEEKQNFVDTLLEIDVDLVDEVIALNENEPNVSSLMLEVQCGVGGQEAMLFARELFTMYENYVKFRKWDYKVLEQANTEMGGIRSGSMVVQECDAYEILKNEAGVHRVQRVPKTERSGRMHTSTAVVTVIPCEDDIKIKLNSNDIRVETKRASGPGGQNVNKSESAVRIVHIPTGIAIECQEDRTQMKNRQIAMQKLHNKLYQMEFTKQLSSKENLRKSQVGLRTRNEKLRTYNYAQNRITDHRVSGTAGTAHNLDEFLTGTDDFDDFVEKLKKNLTRQKLNDILDEDM
ncbi:peptide chain release factor 1-like, mitochondrial [Contarinia nasturtii]|uniref:peptide chain release factor 1-like, mitochondrial n=1 Tax=Contarinia nasturtii TaxID=265458 RepID=UPI0012D4BD95|nr:peptide chain release factor 1-like, mitochondrial [Contarinia nasturtii]